MELSKLDLDLLNTIADLKEVPNGALNIRLNGSCGYADNLRPIFRWDLMLTVPD